MEEQCDVVHFRPHGVCKAGAAAGLIFPHMQLLGPQRTVPGRNVVAETGWRGRIIKLEAGAGGRTGDFYSFRAKFVFF
jgi:hypothetical protein